VTPATFKILGEFMVTVPPWASNVVVGVLVNVKLVDAVILINPATVMDPVEYVPVSIVRLATLVMAPFVIPSPLRIKFPPARSMVPVVRGRLAGPGSVLSIVRSCAVPLVEIFPMLIFPLVLLLIVVDPAPKSCKVDEKVTPPTPEKVKAAAAAVDGPLTVRVPAELTLPLKAFVPDVAETAIVPVVV
jgi:hypothetical protein